MLKLKFLKQTQITELNTPPEPLWNMSFDGSCRKDGSGAGIWVVNTRSNHVECHSYRLNFQCTNNIAKYKALILGLQLLKKLGAKRIPIQGDVELIIKQIEGEYSTKHPRMRAYKIVMLDFLETFLEYDLFVIPRKQNIIPYNLAFSASS